MIAEIFAVQKEVRPPLDKDVWLSVVRLRARACRSLRTMAVLVARRLPPCCGGRAMAAITSEWSESCATSEPHRKPSTKFGWNAC